ncbi:Exosome complex component RRP4 [Phlyctochytrium bullatum]|nr:Exosome complex component RRP4 [Phlyctochytrium bullatum]
MLRGPKRLRERGDDGDEQEADMPSKLVLPGDIITADPAFMRGHGTFYDEEALAASVMGVVERVNKLVSVHPLRARFTGEIGDVVVGRILEVGQKRWRVDIAGRQDAVLPLAAVDLPGGELRRRSESDELQMRQLLTEGDLISAEIQSFFQDGSISLHTRSQKYGKLRTGSIVEIPSSLVKRSKSHFLSLSFGVDIILGLNGYIWVSKRPENGPPKGDDMYNNENEKIPNEMRLIIARVCNCIIALASQNYVVSEASINYAYEASLSCHPKDIYINASDIVNETKSRITAEAVSMDWEK